MKLLNTTHHPLRWVDIDLYNHVNNARYFDFLTEARAQLLANVMEINNDWQFILVDVQCNFRKAFTYPDTVILKQYSEKVGSKSFTMAYEFYSLNDPDVLYAKGQAKLVCYCSKSKRAISLPDIIRNVLAID